MIAMISHVDIPPLQCKQTVGFPLRNRTQPVRLSTRKDKVPSKTPYLEAIHFSQFLVRIEYTFELIDSWHELTDTALKG